MIPRLGALAALLVLAAPASASLHLWNVAELYSNGSGGVQFIELTDPRGGRNHILGGSMTVTSPDGLRSNTFRIDNNVGGDTKHHSLLFATTGFQQASNLKADFTLPDGFLFPDGGTLTLCGSFSAGGTYAKLPTDGAFSRDWFTGRDMLFHATNYAGLSADTFVTTSFAPTPEPAFLGLGLATVTARAVRRKRIGCQGHGSA